MKFVLVNDVNTFKVPKVFIDSDNNPCCRYKCDKKTKQEKIRHFLKNPSNDYVHTLCLMCRDYRPGSQGGDGAAEYHMSRHKCEERIPPSSRYNSRPPTRSGSRPSTSDSLHHSTGEYICIQLLTEA